MFQDIPTEKLKEYFTEYIRRVIDERNLALRRRRFFKIPYEELRESIIECFQTIPFVTINNIILAIKKKNYPFNINRVLIESVLSKLEYEKIVVREIIFLEGTKYFTRWSLVVDGGKRDETSIN